jgi:predicted TIM-barrel fold metal-dependent hydrolase
MRGIDAAIHIWRARSPAERSWTDDDLIGDLDAALIHGAVCIHSRRDAGFDHSYLTGALKRHPDRLAGVCVVDPANPDAPTELRRLVEEDGYSGLRLLPYDGRDEAWLAGREGDEIWEEAARLNIPVDVLALARQLPALRERAATLPQTTIVIDHLALVGADAAPADAAELLRCAELPNVVVKMSALAHLSREPWPYVDVHPLMRDVLHAYGPERVVFGSDWPNLLASGPYENTVSAMDEALQLGADDRAAVFGGNAARIWSMPVSGDGA